MFKRKNQVPNSSLFDLPHDVVEQIKKDFNEDSIKVLSIISKALEEFDFLKVNRTIRCVIFLAHGDIDKLEFYIKIASNDPRDVMFQAEYINFDKENPDRKRDFNKPFGKENI